MVRGDGEEPSIHRKLPGWPLYGEPHWRYPRLLPIARHAKWVSLMASPNSPSKRATERVVASGGALPAPTECPYCKGTVRVVSNSVVYGREYGNWPWLYRCEHDACDSYVGMHPFTAIPLGTMANAVLRQARKDAKNLFQPLWTQGTYARWECYEWLAEKMGIPVKECHFGWFDLERCALAKRVLLER